MSAREVAERIKELWYGHGTDSDFYDAYVALTAELKSRDAEIARLTATRDTMKAIADRYKERIAALREAIEKMYKCVWLPHQITHDELIGACNQACDIRDDALNADSGDVG